jgi:hypothetical protein
VAGANGKPRTASSSERSGCDRHLVSSGIRSSRQTWNFIIVTRSNSIKVYCIHLQRIPAFFCKIQLFTKAFVVYTFYVPTCALLPGLLCTTLEVSSCLTIRCFFMFGTVCDLTQEHLAATVTPPNGVTVAATMMDIIDAVQSAVGSEFDQ